MSFFKITPEKVEKWRKKGKVKKLIKALNDFNKDNRKAAASALGEIGDTGSVKPLIYALLSNKEDKFICNVMAEALAKIGKPAVKPLIYELDYNKEDKFVCNVIAEALAKIGEPAVESLIDEFRSTCEDMYDFDWYGEKDDKYEYYEPINEAVAKVLCKIGEPAVEPLIPLVEFSTETNELMQTKAAEVLGEIGDARAVAPLIDNLCDNTIPNPLWDDYLRNASAEALGKIGKPAVESLIPLVKDGRTKFIQTKAAEVLGKIGDAKAIDPLIEALGDKEKYAREAAAEALGKIGWKPGKDENGARYYITKGDFKKCIEIGKPAVKLLIEALAEEYVREAAAEALGKIGWKPGKDENGARYYIAKGDFKKCIEIGKPAVNLLIEALAEEYVREAAAEALGKIGKISVEQLNKVLSNENKDVREAAVKALIQYGGIDWKGHGNTIIINVPEGGDGAKGNYLGFVLDSKLGVLRVEAEVIEKPGWTWDDYSKKWDYHGIHSENIRSTRIRWKYRVYRDDGELIAHRGVMTENFEQLLGRCY